MLGDPSYPVHWLCQEEIKRCTIHGSRYTVHGSRITVYGLRFTIYDLRFTIYDLRFDDLLFNIGRIENQQIVTSI
jgi:hypothetical protein